MPLALYKINNFLRETISNHSLSVLWNVKVQHEHKVLFCGNNTNSIKQRKQQQQQQNI